MLPIDLVSADSGRLPTPVGMVAPEWRWQLAPIPAQLPSFKENYAKLFCTFYSFFVSAGFSNPRTRFNFWM